MPFGSPSKESRGGGRIGSHKNQQLTSTGLEGLKFEDTADLAMIESIPKRGNKMRKLSQKLSYRGHKCSKDIGDR